MAKKLKFSGELIESILSGKKTFTWRINDDKGLSEGDLLSLCDLQGIQFAEARIVSVNELKFSELSDEEKKQHGFSSDEEMYAAFSKYYSVEVGPETMLKIVEFKVL